MLRKKQNKQKGKNQMLSEKKRHKDNQQYWASVRQSDNLTPLVESKLIIELEADNIKQVCRLRHEIHANRSEESIYNLESANHDSVMDSINELELLIGHSVFSDDEIPGSFDICYDVIHSDYEGEVNEEDYMNWSHSFIRSKIEELNRLAEQFLKNFDKKYKTNLAPTGAFRKLI